MVSPCDDEPETLDKPAQTETVKNTSSYRADAKNFFLTFAQCDRKKEIAVEAIEKERHLPTTSSDWEESLYIEVMEDYVITAELGHLAKDQKKHKEKMRAHFANLKSFIRTEIANARGDERARVRERITDYVNKKFLEGVVVDPLELYEALTNQE